MNKTDILANEKFGGDLRATIEYLMDTEELDSSIYFEEFTKPQVRIFFDILANRINERVPDKVKKEVAAEAFALESMNLTREEVRNMDVNPFKAKVGKDFLKLLIIPGGLISLNLLAGNVLGAELGSAFSQLTTFATSLLTTSLSLSTAKDLLNYFKFKKTKTNMLNRENEFGNGRSL